MGITILSNMLAEVSWGFLAQELPRNYVKWCTRRHAWTRRVYKRYGVKVSTRQLYHRRTCAAFILQSHASRFVLHVCTMILLVQFTYVPHFELNCISIGGLCVLCRLDTTTQSSTNYLGGIEYSIESLYSPNVHLSRRTYGDLH